MIDRKTDYARIRTAIKRSRVVAILGPRQSGKTTLARQFLSPDSVNYFDLENPRHLDRLRDPMLAFESLRGLVVLDEVQLRPDIFPVLRVFADRVPLPARFLVLGSASPSLLRQSSESLAGRIETIMLDGFRMADLGVNKMDLHWRRGAYPKSFIAPSERQSFTWRQEFIETFLQRDLPQMGETLPSETLRRFWYMLAHYHGQIWNGAELARSLAISEPTVRRYLDLLTGVFMVRQLQPWHENLSKRQVKSPKIYIRDSGLLHALLDISNRRSLELNPKIGASWEGFALEEILKATLADQAYFWATHAGAELDLLIIKGTRRIGIECKRTDSPKLTASMRTAMSDLKLNELHVIFPIGHPYSLAKNIHACSLFDFITGPVARKLK